MTSQKKKTILMFPVARKAANLYLPNLVKILSDAYDVIGTDELGGKNLLKLFTCDAVHLNWIERVKGKNRLTLGLSCAVRRLLVYYFVLTQKNIVWTVHNKVAHDKRTDIYSKKVMKTVAKQASRIHCLCKESLDLPEIAPYRDKCVVVPHGDYFNNYGRSGQNLRLKFNIPEHHRILLFSGAVAPYKNIEILLQAFKTAVEETNRQDVTLLIVGKCKSEAYFNELQRSLESSSEYVRFDLSYVPNEALGDYLDQSQALVAPYDQRSSLNSGTFWMACSYHKPMIMPVIGCLKDNPNYENAGWFYHYDSPESHISALKASILRFFDDLDHPEALQKRADNAFSWMTENSWENNKTRWQNLYRFDDE